MVSCDGGITAMLLDTGGILGVGKTTVLMPFSECAIIERDGTASIVLPRLHSGEVLVAPEYQVPGGTRFEQITNHASTLGHAVITKAGELSEQAAEKSAVLVQKTVDRAAGRGHKGAEKVTEPAHEDDKK